MSPPHPSRPSAVPPSPQGEGPGSGRTLCAPTEGRQYPADWAAEGGGPYEGRRYGFSWRLTTRQAQGAVAAERRWGGIPLTGIAPYVAPSSVTAFGRATFPPGGRSGERAHTVRPYGGAPGRRALQKRPVIRHCEESRRPDAAIRATRSRRTDSHGPSGASEGRTAGASHARRRAGGPINS